MFFSDFFHGSENGQVLGFLLVWLTVFLLFLTLVADVGQVLLTKLRMQNAADAAAVSGAIVLRDALNLIALSNGILVLSWVISGAPKTSAGVMLIQDILIAAAPYASFTAAIVAGMGNGADMSYVANVIGSWKVFPSLMVERGYVLGLRVWVVDTLRPTPERSYGDRFVRTVAQSFRKDTQVGSVLSRWSEQGDTFQTPNTFAIAEAAVEGGSFNLIDLLLGGWMYGCSLVPVSDNLWDLLLQY